MRRRASIRKCLERLEAVARKRANAVGRQAIIEVVFDESVGERHLVLTSSSGASPCCFQEISGPGPKLADFGEFASVLYLTTAEMNA